MWKPAAEFVDKIELVINLEMAKAFGPTIPPSLLARADQVIEVGRRCVHRLCGEMDAGVAGPVGAGTS